MRADRPRFLAILGLVLLLTGSASAARAQAEPEEPDSLEIFLQNLKRRTDERFGQATVGFDTTGFDTLLERRLKEPLAPPPSRNRYFQPDMVLRYNRAEGFVLGGGFQYWRRGFGTVHAKAAYAFGSKAVLHEVGWRRILWLRSRYGVVNERDMSRDWGLGNVSLLGVELSYARETALFAPEHSQAAISSLNAFFLGTDRQGYYERRGGDVGLRLRLSNWDFAAGYRQTKEKPLARNATFALLRDDALTPGVRPADPGTFHSLRGRVAYESNTNQHAAVLEGQGLGNDGWRLRGVGATTMNLGKPLRAHVQVEGGAAKANSPAQRLFELGGAKAVPSLPFGEGSTDHLLLGKLELIHSKSLLDLLHLPRPDFFDLQLGAFFHYGVVWDDPAGRDIVFSKPPSNAWRGAAGFSLLYRPGLPDPRVFWRFQFGWPVGPESGDMRVTLAIGREFDLLGKP